VAVLLFGLTGLFGRLLTLSPFLPDALSPRSWHSLPLFAVLGVLLAVHSVAFFQSVQESGVATALCSFAAFPVFVAVLEPLLLGGRPRAADAALTAVAFLGILVLVPGSEAGNHTARGVLWGVASGLTFALLSVLNRRCVQRHSAVLLTLYQDAFAAVALMPFVLPHWTPLTARDVILLLILGVPCTALAHGLFAASLRGIQARTASMVVCLEPVYGSVLAALLLHEIPSVRTVCGGLFIVAVACCATVRAARQQGVAEELPDRARASAGAARRRAGARLVDVVQPLQAEAASVRPLPSSAVAGGPVRS
jgi:drug/metabolite transporter (DMT)-like permease